jgi:hypothetical protein
MPFFSFKKGVCSLKTGNTLKLNKQLNDDKSGNKAEAIMDLATFKEAVFEDKLNEVRRRRFSRV